MEARVHYKHGFKGFCGAGYDWPSSIRLTEDIEKVTCKKCLSMMS